ncbi:MAG: hypothetical protein ACRDBY_13220 [Cetobacterium sp.]
MSSVTGHNLYVQNFKNVYVETTNHCPHCHERVVYHHIKTTDYEYENSSFAAIFRCPSCKEYIMNAFLCYHSMDQATTIEYSYQKQVFLDVPEELVQISSDFIQIYKQSLLAEANQLNQIAGIGFRKSIEFLIKDYLIKLCNEPKETINTLMLGRCIEKIESPKIKALAKAATWIGNDETHYEKRYEDKDVNDMKRFIRALSHFLTCELVATEAIEFTS